MENPSQIRNIIFDLGGVLLNLSPQKTIEAFRQLGLPNVIGEGAWSYRHEVFLKMERGEISDAGFRDGIRELLPAFASDGQIDRAWNAMLLDFPPSKIDLLRSLKPRFGLYLFSNTNNIHITHFRNTFRGNFGFDIAELFDQVYYSHEIGLRKPTPGAFLYLLNDAGLVPGETLFIDDSEKNAAGAAEVGIQSVWLRPGMTAESVLDAFV